MTDARISATGQHEDGHYVTISGLTKKELEFIDGMMSGKWWAKGGEDGRLVFHSALEILPKPAQDEKMMPFWREYNPKEPGVQLQLIHFADAPHHSLPSIIIQHLCGYGYTPERYAEQSALLESYGFNCLRSRREDDGTFWELWYLSSLLSVKGALKRVLAIFKEEEKKLDVAVSFLCANASFGTLDVVVQRAAMQID